MACFVVPAINIAPTRIAAHLTNTSYTATAAQVPLPRGPAALQPTAAPAASTVKQPILAQRFRTKLCNKFATTGSCPYVHRCMFAHGEEELRTAGQNVADGLVSEEAIRAFKRDQHEGRTHAPVGIGAPPGSTPQPLATIAAPGLVSVRVGRAPTLSSVALPTRLAVTSMTATAAPITADDDDSPPPSRDATPARLLLHAPSTSRRERRYQHDPYAVASPWAADWGVASPSASGGRR